MHVNNSLICHIWLGHAENCLSDRAYIHRRGTDKNLVRIHEEMRELQGS